MNDQTAAERWPDLTGPLDPSDRFRFDPFNPITPLHIFFSIPNAPEPPISQPISIEGIHVDGYGLAVEFNWLNDRYQNTILLVEGESRIPLLTSVEGAPSEVWPSSPPMQQISAEEINGHRAVLGVGMAGNSHWSISFLIQSDPLPRLVCEMACLAKEQPQHIGSVYQTNAELLEVSDHSLALNSSHSVGRKIVIATRASNAASTLSVESDRISIATGSVDSIPATVQWKYEILIDHRMDQEI